MKKYKDIYDALETLTSNREMKIVASSKAEFKRVYSAIRYYSNRYHRGEHSHCTRGSRVIIITRKRGGH